MIYVPIHCHILLVVNFMIQCYSYWVNKRNGPSCNLKAYYFTAAICFGDQLGIYLLLVFFQFISCLCIVENFSTENQKQAAVKPEVKSAKDLIIEQKENNKKGFKPINLNLTSTSKMKKPTPRFSANFKPTIGGSSIDDDFIEFCDSGDVVSDALNSKSSCALSDTPKLKKKSPGTNRPVNNNQAKVRFR